MKFSKLTVSVVLSVFLTHVETSQSGVSVIVNPANSEEISASDISRIYLGKKKTYGSGVAINALQLEEGNAARSAFVKGALKKSERQYKAYWAKLLFTGKGKPPEEMDSAAIKAAVAAKKEAIGFIDSADVDGTVKVVYELP